MSYEPRALGMAWRWRLNRCWEAVLVLLTGGLIPLATPSDCEVVSRSLTDN